MPGPSRTARYVADYGDNLTAALAAVPNAAVAGHWHELLAAADSLHLGTRGLREQAATDALAGGADWWVIGRALRLHPQAAFERYGAQQPDVPAPASQRPELAVTLTAGLVDVHRPCPEYGLDADELDDSSGLGQEPTAQRLHAAASALRQRVWFRIARPAGRFIGEPIEGLDVVARWTSVLCDEARMAWPRYLSSHS
jgi:hypothetical protein